MKGDVALTIVRGATIDEASKMLRENYIGAIVVADDAGRVAGILSECDIAVHCRNMAARWAKRWFRKS